MCSGRPQVYTMIMDSLHLVMLDLSRALRRDPRGRVEQAGRAGLAGFAYVVALAEQLGFFGFHDEKKQRPTIV
jgi:hypothetical protein